MSAVWLHPALLEQGELFAQEEVFGSQCAARPGNEPEETDEMEATEDSVVRLCFSCWKTEPGMDAQLYTICDVTRLPTGCQTKFLRTTGFGVRFTRWVRLEGSVTRIIEHHPRSTDYE